MDKYYIYGYDFNGDEFAYGYEDLAEAKEDYDGMGYPFKKLVEITGRGEKIIAVEQN